ncbi:hypothetical protein V5H98_16710 [Georgenia sp. M64]|uniref:hypothetical protein n=1 Tax=Georgenia sp. M64 TaxID=3120520 RepID=UPI0030E03C68
MEALVRLQVLRDLGAGLGPRVAVQVVQHYLERLPVRVAQLERLLAEPDTARAHTVADALAESSATVGAAALAGRLAPVVAALGDGDAEPARAALREIKRLAAGTALELEAVIHRAA